MQSDTHVQLCTKCCVVNIAIGHLVTILRFFLLPVILEGTP